MTGEIQGTGRNSAKSGLQTRLGKRVLPYWPLPFLTCAGWIVLQLIPFTGLFLMLFAAMYWPIVLVNAGFLIIPFDVWRKAAPRWLLVAPFLWFGGYFLFALMSHTEADRLRTTIAQHNAAATLPFNSQTQSLVLERIATDDVAFLFDVPVVYAPKPYSDEKTYLGYRRIEPENCRQIAVGFGFPGVRVKRVAPSRAAYMENLRDLIRAPDRYKAQQKTFPCVVSLPEMPTPPSYRVVLASGRVHQTMFLSATLGDYELQHPDGRKSMIISGEARPLSWFPMPYGGCALVSASSSWECVFGFVTLRESLAPGGKEDFSTARILGAALDLPRRQPKSPEDAQRETSLVIEKLRALGAM